MRKIIAFILKAFLLQALLSNGVSYGDEHRIDDQYVSKQEYEKLKQEVDELRKRLQLLLEVKEEPSSQADREPVAAPSRVETEQGGLRQADEEQDLGVQSREKRLQAEVDLETEERNLKQEAEEAQQALDQFLRRQKVIFKESQLQLELSMAYSHETAENLIISQQRGGVEGFDSLATPKFITRSLNTVFFARYGLADNLEFDFSLPFTYVEQEADFTPFREARRAQGLPEFIRVNNFGLGDISWGLRYAAWTGDAFSVALNFNVKSPTGDESRGLGSGHWNIGGGATFVKTIDPVVLFASAGYTATIAGNGFNPGDQIPYSMGMGFSLNDRVSFLTSLSGAAVRRSEINGKEISGSGLDIDTLQFSTTIQLTRGLFIEPVVGIGLTEETSDFFVGISIPYLFDSLFPLPFFHN